MAIGHGRGGVEPSPPEGMSTKATMNTRGLHIALPRPLSAASTLLRSTSSSLPRIIMHASPRLSFSSPLCFAQMSLWGCGWLWRWGGRAAVPGVRMMGGGPRTFPGGVSKWQWKRMQEKKQKLREKVWLAREKLIYDRRRRAELMAASPVLEKPWERHSRAPIVLPVDFDPHVKAMADRFQKEGGLDLWNDEDGPHHGTAVADPMPASRSLGIGSVGIVKQRENDAKFLEIEQNPIVATIRDANRYDDYSARGKRSKKGVANSAKTGQVGPKR